MTADGEIWHSAGGVASVKFENVPLDGATIIHNHPKEDGGGSSGSDDFKFLRDYPEIKELWAVTTEYDYFVRVLRGFGVSYNYAQLHSGFIRDGEDLKHQVMEWLNVPGYIEYRRTRVSG